MKTKILLLILCLSLSSNVLAVNFAEKTKYPYSLITDDYGILNEDDLHHYTRISTPKLFSENKNRDGKNVLPVVYMESAHGIVNGDHAATRTIAIGSIRDIRPFLLISKHRYFNR